MQRCGRAYARQIVLPCFQKQTIHTSRTTSSNQRVFFFLRPPPSSTASHLELLEDLGHRFAENVREHIQPPPDRQESANKTTATRTEPRRLYIYTSIHLAQHGTPSPKPGGLVGSPAGILPGSSGAACINHHSPPTSAPCCKLNPTAQYIAEAALLYTKYIHI